MLYKLALIGNLDSEACVVAIVLYWQVLGTVVAGVVEPPRLEAYLSADPQATSHLVTKCPFVANSIVLLDPSFTSRTVMVSTYDVCIYGINLCPPEE
jgi:hypothetical protein